MIADEMEGTFASAPRSAVATVRRVEIPLLGHGNAARDVEGGTYLQALLVAAVARAQALLGRDGARLTGAPAPNIESARPGRCDVR
jgi:hypothetical protein